MEDLQTDTLCDYGNNQNQENTDLDPKRDEDCAASLLNGCEEIDPLDLMDHCEDNQSIGSNSDVWKGSDSEEEPFENRPNTESTNDTDCPEKPSDATKPDSEGDKSTQDETSIIEAEDQNDNQKDKGLPPEETNEPPEETKENLPKDSSETKETDTNEDSSKTTETDTKENPEDSSKTKENPEDSSEIKETNTKENSSETKEADVEKKSPEDETTPTTTISSQDNTTTTTNKTNNDKIDDTDEVSEVVEKDPLEIDPDPKPSENDANKEPRHPNRDVEGQDDDVEMDYDAEDDDFDPSLLCPEVSMDVDESPVVTTNGTAPNDGQRDDSPLPYAPVFSTFVDEVTGAEVCFNLTAEEQELRKRLYGPTNPIQFTRVHCTACNVHLGSALQGQNNRFVHPLLKVLICKDCYHFYTSGDFDKDEDGSELYCRWCGQGGQVICCSKCEFVFCKRCIRTNFGRKKMFEIRDNDSWDCFRCNSSQIITQRIACYEFFEYIRQEMSRASTLNNNSEVWSTDHCRCCSNRKRTLEGTEEVRRSKKRKGDLDPDYNPLADKTVILPTQSNTSVIVNSGKPPIILPKPIQLVPRINISKSKDNDIEFVRQIPAPQVTINPTVRSTYRTILPTSVRPITSLQTPTLVRINNQPVPPLVPTGNRILGSALQGRNNTPNMMKHEWFEKTVRAAARVNSHLSYTLTQLNKAQSQAASVEELAVVHNKLQEILSSSINSLIQIRKNLRTEFISGIKTVRLPSKKTESFCNDDDVIFVSAPPTMPMPSTSQKSTSIAKDPLIIIDKSNNAKSDAKPRLKVKSVMELQNVPSECITIPDDTPEPSDNEKNSNTRCNGKSDEGRSKDVDPLGDIPTLVVDTVDLSESNGTEEQSKNTKEVRTRRSKTNHLLTHNVKEKASKDVKVMMTVTVNLDRVDLEELQKKLAKESK